MADYSKKNSSHEMQLKLMEIQDDNGKLTLGMQAEVARRKIAEKKVSEILDQLKVAQQDLLDEHDNSLQIKQSMEEALGKKEQQLQQSLALNKTYENQITDLESRGFAAQQDDISRLQSLVSSQKRTLQQKEDVIHSLEEQITQLQSHLRKAEREKRKLSDEKRDLEFIAETAEKKVSMSESNFRLIEMQYQSKEEHYEKEIKLLQAAQNDANNQNSMTHRHEQRLENINKSIESNLALMLGDKQDLERKMSVLESSIEVAMKENDKSKRYLSRIEHLEEELKEALTQKGSRDSDRFEKILESVRVLLEEKLVETGSHRTHLEERFNALETIVKQSIRDFNLRETNIKAIETAVSTITKERSNFDEKVSRIDTSMSKYFEEISQRISRVSTTVTTPMKSSLDEEVMTSVVNELKLQNQKFYIQLQQQLQQQQSDLFTAISQLQVQNSSNYSYQPLNSPSTQNALSNIPGPLVYRPAVDVSNLISKDTVLPSRPELPLNSLNSPSTLLRRALTINSSSQQSSTPLNSPSFEQSGRWNQTDLGSVPILTLPDIQKGQSTPREGEPKVMSEFSSPRPANSYSDISITITPDYQVFNDSGSNANIGGDMSTKSLSDDNEQEVCQSVEVNGNKQNGETTDNTNSNHGKSSSAVSNSDVIDNTSSNANGESTARNYLKPALSPRSSQKLRYNGNGSTQNGVYASGSVANSDPQNYSNGLSMNGTGNSENNRDGYNNSSSRISSSTDNAAENSSNDVVRSPISSPIRRDKAVSFDLTRNIAKAHSDDVHINETPKIQSPRPSITTDETVRPSTLSERSSISASFSAGNVVEERIAKVASEISELNQQHKMNKQEIANFITDFEKRNGRKPSRDDRKTYAKNLYLIYHKVCCNGRI